MGLVGEGGSPNTAACYFRRVGKISTDLNKKPRDLAAMNKQEAKVFIQDVIGHLRSEGNIGSTIAGYVKALKSWFSWNEIEITGRVRMKGERRGKEGGAKRVKRVVPLPGQTHSLAARIHSSNSFGC